ncbi:MAG: nucleotidyl transferase AbiEii/AbiGii toxin family protein [Deltaproteobacteria bacterium]|nr:nucleotidyl transferase AbiEii/AbiGii toxin family protein [Deltaproteobacteria bacterium]
MSQKNVKNVAASIRQRLLNKAKENYRPFNEILQYYGLERFLYRLSVSKYADKFVLKGALLFTVWRQSEIRSTVDIDLLGTISNEPEAIAKVFQNICKVKVEDDGLRFDSSSITVEQIAVDADYQGLRVQLYGYLGTARIRVQVDIGFSDIITPGPETYDYPTILDLPEPKLNCYNKETMIAEKLQAMVKLDILNSRMKDIYDIWVLSRRFEFKSMSLKNSIINTFKQRETEVTENITTFTERYYQNDEKLKQWQGFLRKSRVSDVPKNLGDIIGDLKAFLEPILISILHKDKFKKTWKPKLKTWQ